MKKHNSASVSHRSKRKLGAAGLIIAAFAVVICSSSAHARRHHNARTAGTTSALGQASITLLNAAAGIDQQNNTAWTIDKPLISPTNNPPTINSGDGVTWNTIVTQVGVSHNFVDVDGFVDVSNTGSAPAYIGNIVVNLQERCGNNWISAAADIADATHSDINPATREYIVAAASSESPTLNASNKCGLGHNYTVGTPANCAVTASRNSRGTFVPGPGSGSLSFTDVSNNTIFSLNPQLVLCPVGSAACTNPSSVNLEFKASFDNTVLHIPVGSSVRAEVIVSFANSGPRGGSGSSATCIDVDGSGSIEVTETYDRSVPTRQSVTIPAAVNCNSAVSLTDTDPPTGIPADGPLPAGITETDNLSYSDFTTQIGGGSGVENLFSTGAGGTGGNGGGETTSVSNVTNSSTTDNGSLTNCSDLDSNNGVSPITLTSTDSSGNPVTLTFPICTDVHTQACTDPAAVTVLPESGGSVNPANFCTYTQGGWGAKPHGNNPGALLAANFSSLYPGGVTVGGTYTMSFTASAAVDAYLPAGGKPGVLTASLINPTSSGSGEFGGQVLALELSVDFSSHNVTPSGLGAVPLCNTGNSNLDGLTISQVLSQANTALGGGALPAWAANISDVNTIVDDLNNAYDNCGQSQWAVQYLCPPSN